MRRTIELRLLGRSNRQPEMLQGLISRSLDLPARLARRIQAKQFEEPASLGNRMSAQPVRDLNAKRRYAVRVTVVMLLLRNLSDCAINMFKNPIDALTRRPPTKRHEDDPPRAPELSNDAQNGARICRNSSVGPATSAS